ncbi:MAG: hypothetical protein ACO3DQ_04600, partial [Cephaloticoccus sp.]
MSLVLGLFATVMAGFMDRLGSLLMGSQIILGIFLGPMLACMSLAVTHLRFRPVEIITGLITGLAAGGA